MNARKLITTAIALSAIFNLQSSICLADDFVPAVETVPSNASTSYTLDSGDSGGDITLQFGTTLAEFLKWNSVSTGFDLSDDLSLTGGLTTSGGANSFNNNSNFATDISTGTSTGAVSIGGGSNTVAVNSTTWDITTAGLASGFTGFTTTGTISLGDNTGAATIDGTNFDLTAAGAMTLTGHLTLSGDVSEGLSGGGLADCDNANSEMTWDATTNKFGCSTSSKDSGVFVDATPAAMTDTDTTELFNDATKPNIITNFAGSNVLVSVIVNDPSAAGNDDEFDAIRIVRTTNGVNPSCTTSAQVGPVITGGFVTATNQPWTASGTFLDTPGVAGTIKYTVCTSTQSIGTVNNSPATVTVSLVEIGS